MNKIVIVAVFIFWTAISVFYANSLFNKQTPNLITQNINNNNSNNTLNALGQQLANHNQTNDCWLAINNKIYDVTAFISSHPGGANEIIKYCGQDATLAFSSKDKNIPQDHSNTAYAMLKDYYIGDFYATALNNNTSNTNSTNTSADTTKSPVTTKPAPVNYTLSTTLVAQHNQASDCWVTAGNNVYNVTAYIRSHPGGQANITKYCGQDIAAAFAAQGHSANANNIFASYKIGTIGSNITQNATTPPAPINNPNNNGDDEEEDDD